MPRRKIKLFNKVFTYKILGHQQGSLIEPSVHQGPKEGLGILLGIVLPESLSNLVQLHFEKAEDLGSGCVLHLEQRGTFYSTPKSVENIRWTSVSEMSLLYF